MNVSKKFLAASTAGVIAIAGVSAGAMAATSSSGSGYSPIVQRLADTFHLDPSKVQQVFQEQRHANLQQRQAHLKDKLDQDVKDGKMTKDQETKLLAELKMLHDKYQSDNMEDRRQNRMAMRVELQEWAKQNGIDLNQVMPSPGGLMHHRTMDDASPSDT